MSKLQRLKRRDWNKHALIKLVVRPILDELIKLEEQEPPQRMNISKALPKYK